MRVVLRSRFWLASVSGFVNSVGFVVLFGVFMTGATGNVVHVGVAMGGELWREAARFGLPIAMLFVTASLALGTGYVLRRRGRDPVPLLAWGEVVVLIALAAYGSIVKAHEQLEVFTVPYYVFLVLAVGALGCQYALVHLTGPPERVSTVVVGIHVIHGAMSAAQWIDARFRHTPDEASAAAARQERLDAGNEWADHLGMLLSFAAGGWLAVVLVRRWNMWSLVVPAVLLVVLQVTGQHRQVERPEADTDVSPA